MDDIKQILTKLISYASITPDDQGCQQYMMDFFTDLGFKCLPMNSEPVANFFAVYGSLGPLLVFAGHTDVVPVGEHNKWHTDPFVLTDKKGILYGRGVADMKGSLACMMYMAKRFITAHPKFPGRLGFLITSGEEGDLYDLGTPYVMEQLELNGTVIDYCVVGEPSSTTTVGDVIKIGRRGSLGAKINVQGKQGHVAYPHLAENPIHAIAPALADLCAKKWDEGNAYFPPTTMQITYLHSGGHAGNIIPGELNLDLNFRFSTEQSEGSLIASVEHTFAKHKVNGKITWRLSGEPFLTEKGALLDSCIAAVKHVTGLTPELSTSGGTSDGRFIAPYGVEVVELGPVNASIHQVNEWVSLSDLESLEKMYFSIGEQLLLG